MPLEQNLIPVIGSGMEAVSGIGSSLINAYSVKQQNKRNMQNWREQNEYNTPKNQRQRYEDAGLNPALMYGGGAGSSGNATPAPNSERSETDLSAIGSVLSTFLEYKKKDAEIENARVSTKRDRIGAESDIIDNALKEIDLKYKDDKSNAERNEAQNKDIITGYESGRYGEDYIGNGADIPYWQKNKIEARIKTNTAEIQDIHKEDMLSLIHI